MPTTEYPKSPNVDTVFVTDDGGKRTRAVKTVLLNGTVDYPKNSNSPDCYVTVDGKKQRALMTVDVSAAGTLEYPDNSNSTKGYVTVGGKKQRVTLTAALVGAASSAVVDELNVTPSVTSQTFTPSSGVDGFNPVNISAVTSAIDSNIQPDYIRNGINILGVEGTFVGTGTVIDPLNVTPSTSAQTIIASGGVDGYSPINVSAVTSAIDSSIVANNIKSGVTILGVTGNVTELDGETVTITPSVTSQTITPTSPHNAITAATVNPVTSAIDSNIAASNIKSGVTILGVTGSVTELNGNTLNVTPTTSSQTIAPTSPYNAFTSVNVSAVTSAIDSSIVASNIKNGVTILGVTGDYTGGAPTYYREYEVSSGVLKPSTTVSSIINLTGVTKIDAYALYKSYENNTGITGIVDMSGIQSCGEYGMSDCFKGSLITGIDMSGYVGSGNSYVYEMKSCFQNCIYLQSADFSSLQNVLSYQMQYCFYGDTSLTTVNMQNLRVINGECPMEYCFYGCTSLTIFPFESVTTIIGYNACGYCFQYTGIQTASFTNLSTLDGYNCLYQCFANTNLQTLSFPALTTNSFGSETSQFDDMLNGVTGCTVHFPSNLQSVLSSWQSVIDGFGGINTTVSFDLPATE